MTTAMTPMPQPTAYLAFDGNCAEAMRFYEKALNGTLQALMSNGQSPVAARVPPKNHHRILHAYLLLPDGRGALMAGDAMPDQPYEGMKGFSLTLNYDTIAEAEQVFKALSLGAKVCMPMQPAFWAKSWGMLTDRFGTPWIVNGELIPVPAIV
jgi:PhnB protein